MRVEKAESAHKSAVGVDTRRSDRWGGETSAARPSHPADAKNSVIFSLFIASNSTFPGPPFPSTRARSLRRSRRLPRPASTLARTPRASRRLRERRTDVCASVAPRCRSRGTPLGNTPSPSTRSGACSREHCSPFETAVTCTRRYDRRWRGAVVERTDTGRTPIGDPGRRGRRGVGRDYPDGPQGVCSRCDGSSRCYDKPSRINQIRWPETRQRANSRIYDHIFYLETYRHR